MDVKKRIVECLQRVGIILPEQIDYFDINLNDYILDSLLFISFILCIEKEFGMEVPDEMLLQSTLSTLDSFSSTLERYINNISSNPEN